MKCPYNDCQKDYNEKWPSVYDSFLSPTGFGHSIAEEMSKSRLYIVTRECRFCHRYFHEVSVGNEVYRGPPKAPRWTKTGRDLTSLVTFPVAKTKFESRRVPAPVREAFNEAERCRSVGSITGTGACLRKAVYELCDHEKVVGADYREKISNLPVKEGHKELLKQFKWLGDNVTKPGQEKYTPEMVDAALEVLPTIVDGMYLQAEKEDETAKLLAKARSANPENN